LHTRASSFSAFVGFSSDDDSGVFHNHVLPAVLIGWNTFAFRVFFGLLLPLLMVRILILQFIRGRFLISAQGAKRE
jgi:hypothetical protein